MCSTFLFSEGKAEIFFEECEGVSFRILCYEITLSYSQFQYDHCAFRVSFFLKNFLCHLLFDPSCFCLCRDDDSEELIQARCHYTQAEVDGCVIYDLYDDALVKVSLSIYAYFFRHFPRMTLGYKIVMCTLIWKQWLINKPFLYVNLICIYVLCTCIKSNFSAFLPCSLVVVSLSYLILVF